MWGYVGEAFEYVKYRFGVKGKKVLTLLTAPPCGVHVLFFVSDVPAGACTYIVNCFVKC